MRSSTSRRRLPVVALMAFGAVAAACTTPISELTANPGKYEGKVVTIDGTVTASANILFAKGFWIEDGTGKILVSPRGAVPKKGEVVTVKGRVDQLAAVGSARIVILKEE
ncbi:MAG: hypothetical protein KA072_06015 [Thermoanaerobaculaceae bacterium]|nr:hypothetical protein [Thermoanaerobaculaceae bacterium]MDI9622055.1 hypothetical protein [Acidobacteriota bacterium]NLH12793.1 hypothetical protein [Holophagae bacterium]